MPKRDAKLEKFFEALQELDDDTRVPLENAIERQQIDARKVMDNIALLNEDLKNRES